MNTNPNDPAMPWEQSPGNQSNLGLSKREEIAKFALGGLLANSNLKNWQKDSGSSIAATDTWAANIATHAADALIAALNKEAQ